MSSLPVSSINPNDDASSQTNTGAQDGATNDPTQQPQPAIQIDLKKSYKDMLQQQSPVAQPQPSPTYTSYGGSSFGAPRPVETYTYEEDVSTPEQVENIISLEVEKSPEVLMPEQTPEVEEPNKEEVQPDQPTPPQVIDLRKPAHKPTPKKKDVAEQASPLTLKANKAEDEFIESILSAHAD